MNQPTPAPSRPPRIPMDVAFQECAAHVRNILETLGIRWSDQAEQAAVCTMLIQAGKSGWILPWNPVPENLPQIQRQVDRQPRAAAPVRVLDPPETRPLGKPASPRPPNPGTSDGARATEAASNPKSFPVMIRAFREIESDLPPEVWTTILTWYGVQQPEDFRPEDVNGAAACYVALKRAREQYRVEQQDTVEHFEATEEGWR